MAKSRKYIKNKKYFIGGLLKKVASITPVGMAVNAIRKKREKDSGEEVEGQEGGAAQDGGGKILKVKVMGEGGGQKESQNAAEGSVADKEDGIKPMKTSSNDTTKMKKGGMVKNRKYVGGGTFTGIDSGKAREKSIKSPKITNTSAKSDSTKFAEKQVKKKAAIKAGSKASAAAVAKGAPKVVGKVGSRFIPGVGYGLLGADAMKLGMEQKAKGYAKMDKRSPGTSRRLETGAYGMQSGAEGEKKVRGTFFGSMKKEGGVVKKYVNGGVNKKNKRKRVKVETFEESMLDGAGASNSKRHKKKMQNFLRAKQQSLYVSLNKKPPKKNIF
jgi:hypothetical protein